jgi:hypothetical protein
MACPHCTSKATLRRRGRTELGYHRFRCRSCRRPFNERTGTPFNDIRLEASDLRARGAHGRTGGRAPATLPSPPRPASAPARHEEPPLLGKRNDLAATRPRAEELAYLVERGAEARCGLKASEAPHRVVPLLDSPVVLLQEVVQVLLTSVADTPAQGPPDRARVYGVTIRRDPERPRFGDVDWEGRRVTWRLARDWIGRSYPSDWACRGPAASVVPTSSVYERHHH